MRTVVEHGGQGRATTGAGHGHGSITVRMGKCASRRGSVWYGCVYVDDRWEKQSDMDWHTSLCARWSSMVARAEPPLALVMATARSPYAWGSVPVGEGVCGMVACMLMTDGRNSLTWTGTLLYAHGGRAWWPGQSHHWRWSWPRLDHRTHGEVCQSE